MQRSQPYGEGNVADMLRCCSGTERCLRVMFSTHSSASVEQKILHMSLTLAVLLGKLLHTYDECHVKD